MATRRDLPLRLHKLRLAGDLAEIRAAQLRFTEQRDPSAPRRRRNRAARAHGRDAASADRGLGGRAAARRAIPRRALRPRTVRRRVLRQRPHGRRVPDGRDAGAAAAGGPAPAAAHLRAGPGQRRARRPADRSHGLGADPAGPGGRQRVRRVPRPRPYLVPLPPHVRRPAPAGTAPHDARGHRRTAPARRALARRARPGRRRHRPPAGGRRLGRGGPHAHRPCPQPHP